MTFLKVGTPFNIDLEFKIAPIGKRLSAWLIDIVIICVYFYAIVRLIYPMFSLGKVVTTAAYVLILFIPVMLYQLILEILMNGQTLGKMAVGIKVMDRDGQEPTLGQYLIRWILYVGNMFVYVVPIILLTVPGALPFLLIVYLPDFLAMVISPRSQRLGDLAAGTVVVDKRYVPDIRETIYLAIEHEEYRPMYPRVMQLSDRDINGIRNLLKEKKTGKEFRAYVRQVSAKIRQVLDVQTQQEDIEFLRQLLRDYNYYTTTK